MFKETESAGISAEEMGKIASDPTIPFRADQLTDEDLGYEVQGYDESQHFDLDRFEKMSVPQLENFLNALINEHDAVEVDSALTEDERRREFKRIAILKVLLIQELTHRKKIKVNLDSLFDELIEGYELDPEKEWEKENILHDPNLTYEQRADNIANFMQRLRAEEMKRTVGIQPTVPDITKHFPPEESKAA